MKVIDLKLSDGHATGYLITDRFSRRYFSGIDVAEGYLLVAKKCVYFTDARYHYATEEKLSGTDIEAVRFDGYDSIKAVLKKHGIKKLGIDYDHTTLSEYEEYKKLKVKLFNGTDIIKEMRSVKSDDEIAYIAKACSITEKALSHIPQILKNGITEKQVKDKIETLMLEYGADGMAFDTIVAFGANSAVPHHETGETPLVMDMPVLIDTGCLFGGYCSDITRTYFYGTPSDRFLSVYNSVLKANEVAEQLICSGTTYKDAFRFANGVLAESGLDKYFTHSLGHGLGLEIHEYPTLSPKRDGALTENTVFTVEPGVYFDGEFGIRIEDTVVIKDGKVRRLFSDSKQAVIISGKNKQN